MNYETRSGRTALIEAVKGKYASIVSELVTYGGQVSRKTNKHKTSAITWAKYSSSLHITLLNSSLLTYLGRKYYCENVFYILESEVKLEDQMAQMFRDICCGNIEVIFFGKCILIYFQLRYFIAHSRGCKRRSPISFGRSF